jgi:hypothetical protein
VSLEPVDQDVVEFDVRLPVGEHASDVSWSIVAEPEWSLPRGVVDAYTCALADEGAGRLALDRGERWRVRVAATAREAGAVRSYVLPRSSRSLDATRAATDPIEFRLTPGDLAEAWEHLHDGSGPGSER